MRAFAGPNKVVSNSKRWGVTDGADIVWESIRCGSRFRFSSPLVQLFNPQSCRGYSLLKASGTDWTDQTKDRWAEPFVEWLRHRGYFGSCSAWYACGDLRLYRPMTSDIQYEDYAPVALALRALNLGGSGVKMDCRAVLAVTRMV